METKLNIKSREIITSEFNAMRKFFDDGNTKSYQFRKQQLIKLKEQIKFHEEEILQALHNDFGKPRFEAFISEIGVLYEEINYAIKHLSKWMKPKSVCTPLMLQPSKSKIYSEPLGVVLIIGPWNYPFQLIFAPLIGAIAAGNCSIIKPSNETPHTALIIEKIITKTFAPEYVSVAQGPGIDVGPLLIENFKFNHIFFTGSPGVGAKIAEMAAKSLTPVTLELGGKSPAIIDETANLKIAAKRMAWAKYFNAGQTCVSPDYVLVHRNVKDQLVEELKKTILEFYGNNPEVSPDFARIVNDKRFTAVSSYLTQGNIVIGGETNAKTRYIAPTVIDNVKMEDSIMQDEIFGPILPILTWENKDEIIEIVRKNRYPLATYIFTQNKSFEKYIINNIEFGGGAINNAIMHLANTNLPFGGVQYSGLGNYHGRYSFDTFSHKKSILKTATWIDVALQYAPYKEKTLNLIKRFMK